MSVQKYGIKYSTLLENLKYLSIIALITFFIQRLGLYVWSLNEVPFSVLQTLRAFLIGFVFDMSLLVYAFIPYVVLFLLFPKFKSKSFSEKTFWVLLNIFNFIFIFFILYMSVSEIFFWDEFKARYNFIAVDYLLYTTEVLKNIWESYPAIKILLALFIADLLIVNQINKRLEIKTVNQLKRHKLILASTAFVLVGLNYFFISQNLSEIPKDIAYQEVSKNGAFSIFHSYFENQINYEQFYIKEDTHKIFKMVQEKLGSSENTKFSDSYSLKRNIPYELEPSGKPKNVVLVLMESMGARFLNSYGSKEDLTPHLDFLAKRGLFLNNLYATGTRTVRGIEAITLSVPPTPGQSIVRRPNNENLVTINSYFAKAGYDVQFLYGGFSYFDNMKYYFEHNNARVLDITSLPESEIGFVNAWGMSDEDLFEFALENADKATRENRPFFQTILTTSNHRPFTYPSGKIDIPSGSGRQGAVKYADYAIGQFIDQALNKEWFKNTIFVFVADHDAGVAGNTEVNKQDYLVPAIFFAPDIIKPQVVSSLASQIDIGPTLLGLLNMSHESFTFGMDLRRNNPERAFISNYQKLGLLKNNFLTLLEPVRKFKQYKIDQSIYLESKMEANELSETVSFYQVASYLFKNKKLKDKNVSRIKSN